MMRKQLIGSLVMSAALAIALPAMAQTSSIDGTSQPSQAQEQVPQPEQGGVNWKGVGIGAGTVAGNLLYVPAKLVYGVLGGITGGASYLLTGGNTRTADTIWRSSLGGDYVLTPDMVSGQKPIHFSGPTSTPPPASSASVLGPTSTTSSYAPTTTASAANPAAVTSPAVDGVGTASASPGNIGSSDVSTGATAVTRPADRGTGPVGSGSSSAPPLGSTSIE